MSGRLLRNHRVETSVGTDQSDRHGVRRVGVFHGGDFQTRFDSVGHVTLQPGAHFDLEPTDELEWCVVLLSGTLRFEWLDDAFDLTPRSAALTALGHGAYNLVNSSGDPAEALFATVREPLDSRPPGTNSRVSQLDRALLSPFAAHLGLGEIQFRSLFEGASSSWNSIDHVLLPHRTSVGMHRNHNVEEVFVILEGRGTMKIESEVVSVAEGDSILNPLGGTHGIINLDMIPLEFLNFSVAAGDEPVEVTDLNDNLEDLVGD
jgi:mannose-6-phosphate isomerase-like protein (cupin superfamily)